MSVSVQGATGNVDAAPEQQIVAGVGGARVLVNAAQLNSRTDGNHQDADPRIRDNEIIILDD